MKDFFKDLYKQHKEDVRYCYLLRNRINSKKNLNKNIGFIQIAEIMLKSIESMNTSDMIEKTLIRSSICIIESTGGAAISNISSSRFEERALRYAKLALLEIQKGKNNL